MSSKQVPFRLIKRPPEEQRLSSATKRLKSTGMEYEVRQLSGYGDKMQTNDEIHQSIEVCPVMKALMDTEAFQRLRNIRQLGSSEYLYTCANGNRFQHSLGVAHLAERMAKTIKEEQPKLGATDKDVLCVKLAGLLHDIGHGPYSHLYEHFRDDVLPKFLESYPELQKEYSDCEDLVVPDDWSHEQSSLQMIDAALAEIGLEIDLDHLDRPLKQIGNGVDANSMQVFKPPGVRDSVLTSRDFLFIKECILGKPLPEVETKLGVRGMIGRVEEKKEWLYDIVNNRHSGLDVDKIDYFARDHVRTIGSGTIDNKMIDDARVALGICSKPDKCHKCDGLHGRYHYMICYPLKRVDAAMNFFKKRLFLHTIIYQHKKTTAVGAMICDILALADPYLRLESHTGEKFPISRAVLKSDFLLRLDDDILTLIAHSTNPKLAEARALFRRLKKHEIYKCAVEQPLDIECDRHLQNVVDVDGDEAQIVQDSIRDKNVWQMNENQIKEGMLREKEFWTGDGNDESFPLKAQDFTVEKYFMHHGQKAKNPLKFMRFFEEMNEKLVGPIEDLPKAAEVNESRYRSIIPTSLQKMGVRVYCRDYCKQKRALVNQVFLQWFERMGRGEAGEAEITPMTSVKLELNAESDDENDLDGNDYPQHAVMLSQESVDSEDEDDGRPTHSQMDQSPIPLRSRH